MNECTYQDMVNWAYAYVSGGHEMSMEGNGLMNLAALAELNRYVLTMFSTNIGDDTQTLSFLTSDELWERMRPSVEAAGFLYSVSRPGRKQAPEFNFDQSELFRTAPKVVKDISALANPKCPRSLLLPRRAQESRLVELHGESLP